MVVFFCTENAVHSFSGFLLYRKLSFVHIISYTLSLSPSHVALVSDVSCAQMAQAMAPKYQNRLGFGRLWTSPGDSWMHDSVKDVYVHASGCTTEDLQAGLSPAAVHFLNIGHRLWRKRAAPTGSGFCLKDLLPRFRCVEAEAIPSVYRIMYDMLESHVIDNMFEHFGFTMPCECGCGRDASKSSIATTYSKLRKLFRVRMGQIEGSAQVGSFEALSNRRHCAFCVPPPLGKGGRQGVVRTYTIPQRTYREDFHYLLAFFEALQEPSSVPAVVAPTAFRVVARAMPMPEIPEEPAALFNKLVETSALAAEAGPEAGPVKLHRQAHHLVLAKALASNAHDEFVRAEEASVRAKAMLSQARAKMGQTKMYVREYESAVDLGKAEPSFLEMTGLSLHEGAADGGASAQGAPGCATDGGAQ
jgi:hypothetical protein